MMNMNIKVMYDEYDQTVENAAEGEEGSFVYMGLGSSVIFGEFNLTQGQKK